MSIKRHFIFWTLYFCYCWLTDSIVDKDAKFTTELIFFLSQNIYLFYSFTYFLTTFSRKNKAEVFKSVGKFVSIIGIYFAVRYFVRYWLLSRYFNSEYGNLSLAEWWVGGVIWITNYLLFSLAYFYFVSSLSKQKDLNKMLAERLQHEKEKSELETTVLKAQINPHFLHNALSFLYAKSLPVSAELSSGILRLSEIMRYSIKPSGNGGLVELADEIEHIQNVIGIAQLRFYPDVYIDFWIDEEIEEIKILPFVLITIVENILKHGVIGQREHPARIRLHIIDQREIVFSTRNKKRIGPKEKSTSIGLENTRKRLQAEYGNDYSLEIKETEEDFSVDLRIRLKPQTEAVTRPAVPAVQMAGA